MLSWTSKVDYSQKGTFTRENINWLVGSKAMRMKESGLKWEIKAKKCHSQRMEFPFMHVGACEPVFIFPTYLSCLDEQQHVISSARRVLTLFLLVRAKRLLPLILPWKRYNSALCWGMPTWPPVLWPLQVRDTEEVHPSVWSGLRCTGEKQDARRPVRILTDM